MEIIEGFRFGFIPGERKCGRMFKLIQISLANWIKKTVKCFHKSIIEYGLTERKKKEKMST